MFILRFIMIFVAVLLSLNLLSCKAVQVEAVEVALNEKQYLTSDEIKENEEIIDMNQIVNNCNDSYKITMEYLEAFNATAEFPDETDKTPMCFIRCMFERTGMIKDGILNKSQIIKFMWPATGDSVEVCQKEGDNEQNPCLKTYHIAKCLMLRAIVDARNKPKI